MYVSALNFVCGVIDPARASTIPRSTSSFSVPLNSTPMLSPACPSSNSFLNISTPVTTRLNGSGRSPTISTSSCTFTFPRSTRPVTTVPRLHQFVNRLLPLRVPFQRLQRAPPDHRHLVPRKPVLRQQLPHLHFHQLEQLRVLHRVALVQKHHHVRHVHLPRQQHVLPRLRHRPVRRRHHQNRPVHLRRAGDHVLDVVGVPRTVHVRVVPVLRLVLHVRYRDRDPSRLLLRRVVDRVKGSKLYLRVRLRQHLGDRRRQSRLPVIDVSYRPHIHVRLRSIKLFLRHNRLASSAK